MREATGSAQSTLALGTRRNYSSLHNRSEHSELSIGTVPVCSLLSDFLAGFPGGSRGKEFASNAEDLGLIPGEGNGNPLQYSCLENSVDRGAWWAIDHRVNAYQMLCR